MVNVCIVVLGKSFTSGNNVYSITVAVVDEIKFITSGNLYVSGVCSRK